MRCPHCGQFLSTRDYDNPLRWNPRPVYELYCKRCQWREWFDAERALTPAQT